MSVLTQGIELKDPFSVQDFYKANDYALRWDNDNLSAFLEMAKDPIFNYLFKDYHQDRIANLSDQLSYISDEAEQRRLKAEIELFATDGFYMFARDLSIGLIDWEQFRDNCNAKEIDIVWEKNPDYIAYSSDLKEALTNHQIRALLRRYLSPTTAYTKLVEAYHRFNTIDSYPNVDYGSEMGIGDYGYRASQLKAFLVATGDLKDVDQKYIEFPTFDAILEDALKRFQRRHYLKETGVLDRVSVLYTKKSIEEKRNQIVLNIERFKLLPRIKDDTYLVINIPEFSLKYIKNKVQLFDMFVVVGREDRPTPVFSDVLEYIVLNPSWIVPQNLIKKDYIPKLIANPNALKEHEIFIHTEPSRFSTQIDPNSVNWSQYLDENKNVPYYFMQYPGEHNVLGEMKFIFPNKYKVYLHDTNAKSLTTEKYRLFSSGCVRLSKPYELLSYLAPYTTKNYDELLNLIATKKTVNIPLQQKIPIHIRYQTVFVNNAGELNFRRDFYGIDALQMPTLQIPN